MKMEQVVVTRLLLLLVVLVVVAAVVAAVVGSGVEVAFGVLGLLLCCSFFSACSLSLCWRRYAALCWSSSCWEVDNSWNEEEEKIKRSDASKDSGISEHSLPGM